MQEKKQAVIEIKQISNRLGGHWIHRDLDLTIYRHDIMAIVGSSGSGKTTLLRNILKLLTPVAGTVTVLGTDITHCHTSEATDIRQRWGVMFQHSALFSSLTVLENVLFPLREFTDLSEGLLREIALLKIALTGLPLSAADKLPSELSGGMQKRAAMARAIALDPELLFLDEPTAGLDPNSANGLDELILHLRDTLGLTIVIITHDLDTLWHITDRVAFLGEGKVLAYDTMLALADHPHPLVKSYFGGIRGQEHFKAAQLQGTI